MDGDDQYDVGARIPWATRRSRIPASRSPLSAITGVIDNDKGTTYTGRADGDAVIELDFRKTLAVTGIQYVVTAARRSGSMKSRSPRTVRSGRLPLPEHLNPGRRIRSIS